MALIVVFLGVTLIASSFFFYRNPDDENISVEDRIFRIALSKVLSVVAVSGYLFVLLVAPAIHRWGW